MKGMFASLSFQARTEAEMNLKAAVDEISTLRFDRETAETSMVNQVSVFALN